MTEFERVLQQCLQDLETGASNVEECLARHPRHARQLEPVLLTSASLVRGREARVSDAFKTRVRNRLLREMEARPRQQAASPFIIMRLATGLVVIMLALLATGTAYAQSALPGDLFYSWKLASEGLWRAISPDPVVTDLAIAERRVDELIAVRNDPALYTEVLRAYVEVTDRLRNEMDADTQAVILAVFDAQIEELNQAGIDLPQPEGDPELLPSPGQPTPTPASALPPVLETPLVEPTSLPTVVPTEELPAVVIPTTDDPLKILPTLELPVP
jgi:hypothetical protein